MLAAPLPTPTWPCRSSVMTEGTIESNLSKQGCDQTAPLLPQELPGFAPLPATHVPSAQPTGLVVSVCMGKPSGGEPRGVP